MQKDSTAKTPRFFRIAQLIGILGVSALLINFFYQVWRIHTITKPQLHNQACDLQKDNCLRKLQGERSLTLSITPRPITANTPLSVKVTLEKMQPDHVAIFLFPYPASGAPAKPVMLKSNGKNTYTGTVSIKKTTEGKQQWIAMVVVESGSERISVPFRFEV